VQARPTLIRGGVKSPRQKLATVVLAWLGAVAVILPIIVLEVVNTPRPQVHDIAYVRALLREARLASENQQGIAGSSMVPGQAPVGVESGY
jgi:hypothetical protein